MAENPRISVFYNVHSAMFYSARVGRARQAPIARHGEKETHLVPLPFAVDSVQFCILNVNRKQFPPSTLKLAVRLNASHPAWKETLGLFGLQVNITPPSLMEEFL